MTRRQIAVMAIAASGAFGAAAFAQGFPHPLYMHGLQDLKQAERSWAQAPAAIRTSRHGRTALQHINAAQNIIFHVAAADHMDAKNLPAADEHPPGGEGAVADTQKYLQQALSDVSQKETDSKLERTRTRAISEVRAALYEVKAATATPSGPAASSPPSSPRPPAPAR